MMLHLLCQALTISKSLRNLKKIFTHYYYSYEFLLLILHIYTTYLFYFSFLHCESSE